MDALTNNETIIINTLKRAKSYFKFYSSCNKTAKPSNVLPIHARLDQFKYNKKIPGIIRERHQKP